ncbi:MAG: hypothetical protein ACRENG_05985 [bacterium]
MQNVPDAQIYSIRRKNLFFIALNIRVLYAANGGFDTAKVLR